MNTVMKTRHALPIALTLTLCLGCAERRPLKPIPISPHVYIGGIDYSQLGQGRSIVFDLDPESGAFVDSFALAAPSFDALASRDGRTLFVATMDSAAVRTVWSIDLKSKTELWRHDVTNRPNTTEIYGRLRLIAGGEAILFERVLINSQNGAQISIIPDSCVAFGGPRDGSMIAIGILPTGLQRVTELRGHDLSSDSSWGSYRAHLSSGNELRVFTARLHADSTTVFAIGTDGPITQSWFVVGNLTSGETLFEHRLVYPRGEISVSPDGSKVVVSDPSRSLIFDSSPTLDVFSIAPFTHLHRFEWTLGQPRELVFPGQIEWVDADHLVATSPGDFTYTGAVIIVSSECTAGRHGCLSAGEISGV